MSSTAPQLRSRLPRIAEAAVQRARLTVVPRPRTRPRAPRVPFVTLVSVLLLGGVVGLLLFNTSMQQASFRAAALDQQVADLTAQEEALRTDLQELSDPARIADEAQQAGMVIAGPPNVMNLGTGEVSGDAQPALPAQPSNTLPITTPGPEKPAALDPDPIIIRDRGPGGSQDGQDGQDGRNGRPDGGSHRPAR
jgi:cell division protein FtsL